MTFDPTIKHPGIVNGETGPKDPIDRYLDSLFEALGRRIPVAVDDLHTAARSAGHLFGAGVADALGRIVGNLGDLDAAARSDLVYLRRAVDERQAAYLAELDHTRATLQEANRQNRDVRTELERATTDANDRLMTLQDVRRKLTDVATFAKTSDAVDWLAVIDSAVRTIDAATITETLAAEPDAGDAMAGDLLGRWPRSHAEAGVAPDPELDEVAPVFVNGRPHGGEPEADLSIVPPRIRRAIRDDPQA